MSLALEMLRIEHNSSEWLSMRKTGIGGSDAAAILGLSPFKTNIEVWEEKVGLRVPEDISDKAEVRYGKDAEDLLFRLFDLDHPEYLCLGVKSFVYRRDFMFASLDGEIVEIASNREGVYEGKTTELHSRAELDKWDHRVPNYYYTQILHYLIVTGRDFAIIKAQIKLPRGEDGALELLTRHYLFERKDLLQDMKYLYLQEKEFWGYVERQERPPLRLPRI